MYITNNLERLLGDRVTLRVFKILSKQNIGITGRQLAIMAKTSTFKISHVLRNLVAQGILFEEVVGKAHLYKLNVGHIFIQKVVSPLLAFESGLLSDLGLKLTAQLKPQPISVILFGSTARGEETAASDFDCLLIYADQDPLPTDESLFRSMAEDLVHYYGNFLNIKVLHLNDFLKRLQLRDPLIINIVKEGKAIYGKTLLEIITDGKTSSDKERSEI